MITKIHRLSRRPSRATHAAFITRPIYAMMAAVVFLGLLTSSLHAQIDNFNTGTAAGWQNITATNFPAAYSFPLDVLGGQAYRLRGLRPAGTISGVNSARVIAYRTNQIYTNFFVAVDILAWGAPNHTNGNIFGLIARGDNLASGLGRAVILSVEPNRWYKGQGSSRGQAQLISLDFSNPDNIFTVPSALANCTLAEGRAYRFVLTGVSNVLTAAIYDLEDLTRPVLSFRGDDRYQGLQFLWPANGYCGIFNFSGASGRPDEDQTTDTTFDNFVAMENAPTNLVAWPGTPHGLAGIAQVVNRSPISFTNFYPASGGISFQATTLTTTNTVNTNAIKLFLNGVDVSAGLVITGPATNATVSYNGLASNAVYDARIELQDALGRKTTNAWAFDTFSDAYLTNALAKNIEVEDWDFDGGQFIDDPLPSGVATNDPGTVINSGVGYVDLIGTPDVDFQYAGTALSQYGREFRSHISQTVATQQGNFGAVGDSEGLPDLISTIDGDASHPSGVYPVRTYEVQRQKYKNVDTNLHEYLVRHTEASGGKDEWLNYTRIFTNTGCYNVYLRHACGSPQDIWLDHITALATNNLGTFTMPGYTTVLNYRYVPLRDSSGKLAVVQNLSGTNTLRLTVPLPYSNAKRYNLALNYLAFVPAAPQIVSASQVDGPYAPEVNLLVDTGSRRITVPQSGATRFYRVIWDHQVLITSVKLSGGNVELEYE